MAISFVQGKATSGSTNATATINLTLTSNATGGNAVVVFVFVNDNITVSSITDSLSNTYTQALAFDDSANSFYWVYAYYAVGITGGSCTIHTNFSSTGQAYGIVAQEFSGVATSLPTDGTNHASGSNNVDPTLSGSVTTTVNNDMVVGGLLMTSGVTFTAGAGFSNLTSTPNVNGLNSGTAGMISGLKATAGASNPSFSTGGATGNGFVGGTLALKAAVASASIPNQAYLKYQAVKRSNSF